MYLSDKGFLLRRSPSGERFLLLALFLKEHGLKYALAPVPKGKKTSLSLPDFLQSGSFVLEQKDPAKPAFLKDFMLESSCESIARSYQCLKAASELSQFFEKNLIHMESYEEAWDLLEKALLSMERGNLPEAVLMKTYFIFARTEGYPIVAHWLNRKRVEDRKAISEFLQSPVNEVTSTRETISGWMQDLKRFLERETDLIPPD